MSGNATITTARLSKYLDAELLGNGEVELRAIKGLEAADLGDISFLSDYKYEKYLYTTNASAVIVNKDFAPQSALQSALIKVSNVDLARLKIMELLQDSNESVNVISETTQLADDVVLGDDVGIGHFSIIGANTLIDNSTVIGAQVFIGDNVRIGKNCKIYSGVKIYSNSKVADNVIIHANAVIGADGFGFLPNEQGEYQKVPHMGDVVIESNVEIGANTVIDRGSVGSTIIGKGVKLDNLIQVAHNVVIKQNTVIAAQTGIAGSTTIGANCIIGGQVGIVGHINIADKTQIQAQSGVAGNVKKENTKLYGSPAIDYNNYLKSYAIFKSLPSWRMVMQKMKAIFAQNADDNRQDF